MTHDPRTIHILAVDDSDEDCRLYRIALEGAGFAVETAQTARAARELLARRRFALMLVDLRLPDGDGLDLLAELRSRDPHAMAIVVSGFASADNAVAAMHAGAYDFLTKPCPPERLLAAVDRAAEKWALTRALEQRTRELEEANASLDQRVRGATREIFALNEKLKRTVAELRDANEAQTRALEEVAHELKNPLSVIWGYSSFLLRAPMEQWSPADLKRSLESMHRNARHLQDLIEELLDTARLAGRKIVLEKETFPAAEAIREAVDGLRLPAQQKGVALEAEPIDPGCLVCADRNRLRQVLLNLIANAVKFTPKGGAVSVAAGCGPEGALFRVEDTGPGIPPDQARRIFERFYQIRAAHARENKGLGLGLNIADGLVKLHGGRIWVESEQGKGARFFVALPRAAAAAEAPRRPAEGDEPVRAASN